MRLFLIALLLHCLWAVAGPAAAAPAAAAVTPPPAVAEVRGKLESAISRFRTLATNGGYLWWYAPDGSARAGENAASATQIWVQPPGTPAVGMTLLHAYAATGEPQYRDAALAAAEALAWGQLESGGWTYSIDFDPDKQTTYRRADVDKLNAAALRRRRNVTTFDDDNTQSALRFLMAVTDAASPATGTPGPSAATAATQTPAPPDQRLARIRDALDYGLRGLLRAQYPNGAWPQGYDGSPRKPEDYPVVRARTTFQRERPASVPYWFFYTFNDHVMRNCIRTVLDAHRRYNKPEYIESARKAGHFILLAQLPEPQPGWAQQYNTRMEAVWARRFEPPAVSSGETAGVIRVLVDLFLATGDEKYMAPIPPAIAWLQRSQIAPNRWSRFYEIGTNKPLYFTRQYELVYTDTDLPTHYAFQGDYGIAGAISYYEEVQRVGRAAYLAKQQSTPAAAEKQRRARSLAPRVRTILDSLDAQGRWVRDGKIESSAFNQNVATIAEYLEVTQ